MALSHVPGVFILGIATLALTAFATDQSTAKCANMLQLKIENTTISEAAYQPAGTPVAVGGVFSPRVELTSLPDHCLVHGEVNHHTGADGKPYGDRFELRMPTAWQGRLLYMGGGGLNGILNPALGLQGPVPKPDSKSALSLGYAVVSTDGGHNGAITDGSFGSDPNARDDYNYRSTKLVTDAARKIIAQFYSEPIKFSYFQGCSNGGREGLMTAERYPEYFDGVIAGAPAFNLTHASIGEAWNTMQLASIAPKKQDGTPDLSQSLTESDLKLLVHSVLEKCDALDGLKDNLIYNPEACRFDPATLQCAAGQASPCLSAEKVRVIKNIFDGPHDSSGRAIYSPLLYDSGVAAEGWRVWMTGLGTDPPINVLIFPSFINGIALAGQPPPINIFAFDFDKDAPRVDKAAAEIDADSTDWTAFRKRHGKLLLYTGMSDPCFPTLDLIRFYKQIEQQNGGASATPDFARLFLTPGMNHCGGGPGLDEFDTLSAMQQWVEHDKAPDSMLASGQAFPGRTRPLCAYPKIAKYNGSGNPEDAASFTCRVP